MIPLDRQNRWQSLVAVQQVAITAPDQFVGCANFINPEVSQATVLISCLPTGTNPLNLYGRTRIRVTWEDIAGGGSILLDGNRGQALSLGASKIRVECEYLMPAGMTSIIVRSTVFEGPHHHLPPTYSVMFDSSLIPGIPAGAASLLVSDMIAIPEFAKNARMQTYPRAGSNMRLLAHKDPGALGPMACVEGQEKLEITSEMNFVQAQYVSGGPPQGHVIFEYPF
jgi:hypothetical protein